MVYEVNESRDAERDRPNVTGRICRRNRDDVEPAVFVAAAVTV
jgi:hypothetical protein